MSKSSHRQSPGNKTANSPISENSRRSPLGERGLRRRDLILDTAADLLAEGGPEAINTNALAERAGISVGSVYQYFSNKEAILTALGERYMQQLGSNTVAALQQDVSGLDFATIIDRVIDPMIAFERKYPAFRHLNAGQSEEGTLAQATQKIDREILATIYDLLIRISPDLNPIQSWQIARMMKALYKGMSYLIQQEKEITKDGGDIDNMISDMKRMMADYLEHHLDCL
ncbi:TetR family transcriptional regulator [Nostoc linckia z18]|jgi:AcrR family transcriptional regulator|uniref:TetR family transcriptional regulator n=2 Tax=Nostoc linckia TaxID=92942 RepID=A0A9Q5Z764_NOSLI|nr:TetR/AcrR family transcriptional regulator [Nostoc linckia]PHK28347.1 TetR family transcriptional regulator [Nostoc linckia z15]PHK38866.1 TetR family transcriptional regulator [Nostoc linckia z16]PHJ56559.1 TetR family transcriptional regulator [Nostoc linckia z2]PHJ56653.1 TetR family transcriptional regulator [Nostoc linckia z1]PHJ58586.1 TetR family transcriptional regulator [Nostoc linckia z3]